MTKILFRAPKTFKWSFQLDIGYQDVSDEYLEELEQNCEGRVIVVNHYHEEGNTVPRLWFDNEEDFRRYSLKESARLVSG